MASHDLVPAPVTWRWSPESHKYYEQEATRTLDQATPFLRSLGTHEQCQAMRMQILRAGAAGDWGDLHLLSKRNWLSDDPETRARVLRDTARGFQQDDRHKRLGLLTSPGDLATNYRPGWWKSNVARVPDGIDLDFFTPRMAYQTWLALTTEGDMFWDDFKSYGEDDERIPRCAAALIDGQSAFFWQLSDCFESLIQKIAKGEGPVPSCVGECIALHLTLTAVKGWGDGSGGSLCEQLDDDKLFQSLPKMPNDSNFAAWYGWRGPLGDQLNRIARPLDLYTPKGFDAWAPVANDVLERHARYNPFRAESRQRLNDIGQFDHVKWDAWVSAGDERRQAEQKFRQGVHVPQQVLAEHADHTEPNQWFRPFPTDQDLEDDDEFYARIENVVASLPGLPINRTDGATLHIGVKPFEGGESCFLVTIEAHIMLPGLTNPIGRIEGHGVQRDISVGWDMQRQRDFFWTCDAVSEEFINAVLTFCDLERAAAIKTQLKAAPCNIPDSCDTGPLICIHSVRVDSAHRGRHIGIDALDILLKNIRWSIAVMDAAPMAGSGEETAEQLTAKCEAYSRYFEKLGFVKNVPGGYPADVPSHSDPDKPRFHWLSHAQFSSRVPESQRCIVCLDAPKEMAMVHGDSAHTVCCRACTTAIRAANNECPVCRQSISAVFRNFQ